MPDGTSRNFTEWRACVASMSAHVDELLIEELPHGAHDIFPELSRVGDQGFLSDLMLPPSRSAAFSASLAHLSHKTSPGRRRPFR